MARFGLGRQFLAWFALTWLLCSFATGIGLGLDGGSGEPVGAVLRTTFLVILLSLLTPWQVVFSLAVSGVVWSISWALGRRQGLDAQWNACLAALSCGMVSWGLQVAALISMPRLGGIFDITPKLPFLVVSAGFTALIGPPVAAHLFARGVYQPRRRARPARDAAA